MRLLLGLILWVGVPFYWLTAFGLRFSDDRSPFDLGTAIVLTLFALGMAYGEYRRATDRSRREAAARAQQQYWLSQEPKP